MKTALSPPGSFSLLLFSTAWTLAAPLDTAKIVLDVRTADEFAKSHIPGAINIDINGPGFAEKAGTLDRSNTLLVNCCGGSRGAVASAVLARLGFKTICNLEGGLEAWQKEGFTSEQPKPTTK
jgi:rhodanese-related sulfurtransferase